MIPGLVASGAVIATGGPPRDPTTYAAAVLADTPIRYYKLNESTGHPVDSSGNGGNGTLTASGFTWAVDGAVSTALRLDGTGHFMLADPSASIPLLASQTRICWVKTTSIDAASSYGGDAALTIFGDTTGVVWDSFGVHNGKARYTRFNNSAWQTFDSTASINDGEWHLIAVTYNHSTLTVVLYVDGAADGGGTMTGHQNQGGINTIGQGQSGNKFIGDIDEVEFDNSVYGADRILARWNA